MPAGRVVKWVIKKLSIWLKINERRKVKFSKKVKKTRFRENFNLRGFIVTFRRLRYHAGKSFYHSLQILLKPKHQHFWITLSDIISMISMHCFFLKNYNIFTLLLRLKEQDTISWRTFKKWIWRRFNLWVFSCYISIGCVNEVKFWIAWRVSLGFFKIDSLLHLYYNTT